MRLIFVDIDIADGESERSEVNTSKWSGVVCFFYRCWLVIETLHNVCLFSHLILRSSQFWVCLIVAFLASFMCANCTFHCMLSAFCFIFYLLINIERNKETNKTEIVISEWVMTERMCVKQNKKYIIIKKYGWELWSHGMTRKIQTKMHLDEKNKNKIK